MYKILTSFFIVAISLVACDSNASNNTNAKNERTYRSSIAEYQQTTPAVTAFPIKEIIAGYLQLKNALVKDNGKAAAAAGNTIVVLLAKVDKTSLSASQQKIYGDLEDDIKENAEHIGANAAKIEHQREHFEMLSKDIADLIKTFGNGGQTLYKDFCPMANNGKGAIWISEIKEIKNPYFGGKMATCGSVKETIK